MHFPLFIEEIREIGTFFAFFPAVINKVLSLGTVYYQPWIIPIPFIALIFIYEEFRKLYIRQIGAGATRILI